MILTELVATETGVPVNALMLLRHNNESTRFLIECGASIEEYTAIQPIGSKYDYFRDPRNPIQAVIVIVDDKVYGVFKLAGISRTGSSFEIASPEYVEFDRRRDKAARDCHYFSLEQQPTSSLGRQVLGWEGRTRTPVQRFGDSFFSELLVDATVKLISEDALRNQFQVQVRAAIRSSSADRGLRLSAADKLPKRVAVVGYQYMRNADVVAEVLFRANGICARCLEQAPFLRKTDGTPYLEVHHRRLLANGGDDTVENAEAICPNCHRKAHYGDA